MPNWTGRLPIIGWPLDALFALWLLGRGAIALSTGLPPLLVALVDLAFSLVLPAAIAREVVRGRNWRNLIMLAMFGALILGNAVFHLEAARDEYAAQAVGLRLGQGAAVMMIAVIGGRIVPSFTRNWLVKRGSPALPASPMQRLPALRGHAVAALRAAPLGEGTAGDGGLCATGEGETSPRKSCHPRARNRRPP